MVEHPQNPNKGDEDVILESVEKNSFYGFCVVQKSTKHILVGNHRSRVAKMVGVEFLPVFVVDCDDETAVRIMLADNQTAKRSRQDENKLVEALTLIDEESGSLVGTGFSLEEYEQLFTGLSSAVEVETIFKEEESEESSRGAVAESREANIDIRIGDLPTITVAISLANEVAGKLGSSKTEIRNEFIKRIGFEISDLEM